MRAGSGTVAHFPQRIGYPGMYPLGGRLTRPAGALGADSGSPMRTLLGVAAGGLRDAVPDAWLAPASTPRVPGGSKGSSPSAVPPPPMPSAGQPGQLCGVYGDPALDGSDLGVRRRRPAGRAEQGGSGGQGAHHRVEGIVRPDRQVPAIGHA
jgi:hypothetical protein